MFVRFFVYKSTIKTPPQQISYSALNKGNAKRDVSPRLKS
jgi:hypothetical protein